MLLETLLMTLNFKQTSEQIKDKKIVTRHMIAETKLSKVQVLLVEDNLINQKVASRMIGKFGRKSPFFALKRA